jgi:hypothetical protein
VAEQKWDTRQFIDFSKEADRMWTDENGEQLVPESVSGIPGVRGLQNDQGIHHFFFDGKKGSTEEGSLFWRYNPCFCDSCAKNLAAAIPCNDAAWKECANRDYVGDWTRHQLVVTEKGGRKRKPAEQERRHTIAQALVSTLKPRAQQIGRDFSTWELVAWRADDIQRKKVRSLSARPARRTAAPFYMGRFVGDKVETAGAGGAARIRADVNWGIPVEQGIEFIRVEFFEFVPDQRGFKELFCGKSARKSTPQGLWNAVNGSMGVGVCVPVYLLLGTTSSGTIDIRPQTADERQAAHPSWKTVLSDRAQPRLYLLSQETESALCKHDVGDIMNV